MPRQGFAPYRSLNGFGDLGDPLPDIRPIPAAQIDSVKASPGTPAGLYRRGGQERAINIMRAGDRLTPIAGLPPAIALRSLAPQPAVPLAPWLFAAAMVLFLAGLPGRLDAGRRHSIACARAARQ